MVISANIFGDFIIYSKITTIKQLFISYKYKLFDVVKKNLVIANYCDNVTMQRENIPNHVWQRWKNFIIGQLEISTELKKFMLEYKDWYSVEMFDILNEVQN